MKVIDHLNRNNPLSDKQYVFRSSMSTADAFILTHRISETLDSKLIARTIALDILKKLLHDEA